MAKPVEGSTIGTFDVQLKVYEATESTNGEHYSMAVKCTAECRECSKYLVVETDQNAYKFSEMGQTLQYAVDDALEEMNSKIKLHKCPPEE